MNKRYFFGLLVGGLLVGPAAWTQDLDFAAASYPAGATSHTYPGLGNPAVDVSISITGPGVFSNNSPSASGNGLTTTSINFSNPTEQKVYTFTFSAAVLGLSFLLRAVNQNLGLANPAHYYQDQVTIAATNDRGQAVPVQFNGAGTNFAVAGNTLTANSGASTSQVGVTFGDGVQTLIIRFGNGPQAGTNPIAQGFTIGDMSWSALPVRLVALVAQPEAAGVRLRWETADDGPARPVVVERSFDAVDFQPIGEQAAAATTTDHRRFYEFFDPLPLRETRYYRLRLPDRAGSSEFSRTVAATDDGPLPQLELREHPTPGDRIGVFLKNLAAEDVTLSTLTGRPVPCRVLRQTAERLLLLPEQPLGPGLYLLRATAGRHQLVRKVVVQ